MFDRNKNKDLELTLTKPYVKVFKEENGRFNTENWNAKNYMRLDDLIKASNMLSGYLSEDTMIKIEGDSCEMKIIVESIKTNESFMLESDYEALKEEYAEEKDN